MFVIFLLLSYGSLEFFLHFIHHKKTPLDLNETVIMQS